MKISKLCVFATACAIASGAFADAANVLVSFSTVGPDTYADKTPVLDGEWYALVWSKDGVFEGVGIDGKAVDPNDEVVMMASLAKGGRCPYTIFQIDSKSVKAHDDGTYAVYLLDTRNAARTAVAAKDEATGLPKMLNGTLAAASYAAAAATAGGVTAKTATGAASWAPSGIPADVPPPQIVSFKPNGAQVEISVDGMVPGVQYNVRMGRDVGKLDTFALQVPQMSDNSTFRINQGDAQFFQVTREPLAK